MGKGDKARPLGISLDEFGKKWDKIFIKTCTLCGAILEYVKGDEPFNTDHYQCPKCDSTFYTFDKIT